MSYNRDVQRNERDLRARRRSAMKAKASTCSVGSSGGNPPSSALDEGSVQYIERRFNEEGLEEIRLCKLGFVPTDATDTRYSTLRDFTMRMLSEILDENLPVDGGQRL